MDIGLYGKLPSHGDFLRRLVDDTFVGVWDAWLQQGISASRAELSDRWLDVYLTSPLWRFTCDQGICGTDAYAGVMMPSVDRVGRYFPLTLVWKIPEAVSPLAVMRLADTWFDVVERLLVETLAAEQVDFEEFYQQLLNSSKWLAAIDWRTHVMLNQDQAQQLMSGTMSAWQIPTSAPAAWSELYEQLMYARLRATQAPLVTLWTEGSAVVEPCCLYSSGLPAPHRFSGLLDGDWQAHGWMGVEAEVAPAPRFDDTLVEDAAALTFESAALSDVGCLRDSNQDAFLAKPEVGLWVVADGIGGYRDGDVASRMVCDALADWLPSADLDEAIEVIKARLNQVNDYLHRAATRPNNPVQSGSTVAVLVTRGNRAALIWAGDSRIYRWREAQLTQLTFDHSWTSAEQPATDGAITRAVGGEAELLLDVHFERIQAGDKLLLCTDGLTRELDDDRIAAQLVVAEPRAVVQSLVDAALTAGGKDNVTVVLVAAQRAE